MKDLEGSPYSKSSDQKTAPAQHEIGIFCIRIFGLALISSVLLVVYDLIQINYQLGDLETYRLETNSPLNFNPTSPGAAITENNTPFTEVSEQRSQYLKDCLHLTFYKIDTNLKHPQPINFEKHSHDLSDNICLQKLTLALEDEKLSVQFTLRAKVKGDRIEGTVIGLLSSTDRVEQTISAYLTNKYILGKSDSHLTSQELYFSANNFTNKQLLFGHLSDSNWGSLHIVFVLKSTEGKTFGVGISDSLQAYLPNRVKVEYSGNSI